ncbi:MAG TPA: hypothetical protein VK463_04875 [Desulfomonilaceae bacterium]|nr:hypothetical protein [Desulfomonilaceae bacterium]
MVAKRKIKAADMVKDIRAGLTDPEIMEKHTLSPKGLQSVLRKLLEAEFVSPDEIYGRSPSTEEIVDIGASYRIIKRYDLDIPLHVHEFDNPDSRGLVRDISVNGVGICGIEASVDEIKIFVIPADRLLGIERVAFEAVCRWVTRDKIDAECVGGFEILNVMEGNLKDLELVLRAIPLEDRVAIQKKS